MLVYRKNGKNFARFFVEINPVNFRYRLSVLAVALFAIILSFTPAHAQQTNNLETYQVALHRQEAGLLTQYGNALDAQLKSFKQKGDIEQYLVVEAEKKRFDEQQTVRPPVDAEEAFRPMVKAYNKASVDLLKKYIVALDGLIKKLMIADRIEEAKEASVEKSRAVAQLGTAETMLPKTNPVKVALNSEGEALRFVNPETNSETQALEDMAPAPPTPNEKTAGPISVDLGGGMKLEMVRIRAGGFLMGSPANEAERQGDEYQHPVKITQGFWMGKYPVTQTQWERVMMSNPSKFKNAGNNAPVEQVSWEDCQEFIQKLNQTVEARNLKFRLPTEAEWEYACRAGTKTRFYSGNDVRDAEAVGWHYRNANGTPHPVGQKKANAWGLYDMHGNVWEWCQDWYGGYGSGDSIDPKGPSSGAWRVVRGGSWNSESVCGRSAGRSHIAPDVRSDSAGLRVVAAYDQGKSR